MIHSGTRETFLKIGDLLHALPISGGSVQFLRHPHTQTYTQFYTQTYTQFYTQKYTQFKFFFPLWDWTIFASFETGQFLQVLRPDNFCKFSPSLTVWPCSLLLLCFHGLKWLVEQMDKILQHFFQLLKFGEMYYDTFYLFEDRIRDY